jgi:peptide/nickel transport system ATP-binding protein
MTSQRQFDISVSSNGRSLVTVSGYPVFENGITFLFGESGIGKSVISKSLYGYSTAPDLHISVNGQPYAYHLNDPWTHAVKRNSFFVFQEPSSHLNPLLTIREQLNEGSLLDIGDTEILNRLWQTSSEAVIDSIMNIFPKAYRPSGGEKQRVLLAMAFKRIDAWIVKRDVDEPTYFVFDEPTGSLDNNYRNQFLQLLFEKYVVKPFTVVIITHDYSIISEVYRHYRRLINYIRFLELSRENDAEVAVHNFSPEEYLSWLETPKKRSYPSADTKPVLTVSPHFSIFNRNLTIYADHAHREVAPLVINKGDIVYLKAPSGIGKTTLAKIIMGIYRPDRFSMKLDGQTITERSPHALWQSSIWGKRAGMVFQHADESLNLASTVRETFKGLPLRRSVTIDFLESILAELFDKRIIDVIINKKVAYLSGGQKQRLNLLRTLILNTGLIILDEPLNGLDFASVKRVLDLLDRKRSQGIAVLMISHNEEIFEHFIGEENIYYLGSVN